MKRLELINLDDCTRKECNAVLLHLSKRLNGCEYASGKEGTAYFVNDKYIVKKYNNAVKWEILQQIFDSYCEENSRFSKLGYNVPKIYSWLNIPRRYNIFNPGFTKDYDSDFYVLQERVAGRELYLSNLEDIYSLVSQNLSKEDLKDLICNPQKDLGVYKDIIRTYIKDFIEVNQFIESMPMSELEAFVYSIKEIFEKGEYSVPDIHSKNIILTDERLMLIDNHMSRKSDDKYLASVDVERFVATRLIIMFKSNRVLGGVKKSAKHLAMYPEIEDLVKLNRELCSAAMEKLFVAMNNVLGKSYNWENVYGILNKNTSLIVGDENAKNILSVLE